MSIIDRLKSQPKPESTSQLTKQESTSQLTKQEIEFLLMLLKDVAVRGDQVETFYNIILKLQDQYLKQ